MIAPTLLRLLAICVLCGTATACAKHAAQPIATPDFLSDVDEMYRRLEERQRQNGECRSHVSLLAATKLFKRELDHECQIPEQQWLCKESYIAIDTLSKRTPTTRCESGLAFMGPALYAMKLDLVLAPQVPRPRLGTLRTGDINAMAQRFGNPRDYLVLFNPDLTNVHGNILRFVLNLMDITEAADGTVSFGFSSKVMRERIAADPGQAAYFRQLIAAAVRAQELPIAPDMQKVVPDTFATLFRSPLHQRLLSSLTDEGEHFVVAHEYAHAALDHGAQTTEDHLLPGSTQSVELVTRSTELEYLADATGLTLWLRVLGADAHADQKFLAMLPAAPEMFLTSARLMELEREVSGLHRIPGKPPADTRREKIRAILSRTGLIVDSSHDYGATYHLAALVAWATVNQSRLEELHRRGVTVPLASESL
jgi:hypothetical protein